MLRDPALHTYIGGGPNTPDALRARYERLVAKLPGPVRDLAQPGTAAARGRPPGGHRPGHGRRRPGSRGDRPGGGHALAGPPARR
ncbi:hypothetical protein GCM10023084_32360 [Streptomyces lacrimifluminis]